MASSFLSLFLVFTIPLHSNHYIEKGQPSLKFDYCQPEDSVTVPDYMESSWVRYVDETQDTTCQKLSKSLLINISEYK